MSAFYDQASLVVVPSGYKTSKVYAQKPLTTDGQLTFSRASTATRVNSAGLIEKVRTNHLLNTGTFTGWALEGGTISGGFADPEGGTSAYKYIQSSGGLYSTVSFTDTLPKTMSVYLKSVDGTSYNVTLGDGATGGTIATVTNTWQRFHCTYTSGSSRMALYVYGIGNAGGVLLWHPQGEISDFGPTAYIPTTSAAVSVGPVANVPRLDYLNSSCPRLLLEPQRTNLVQYSEQFDNAAWVKTSLTITANASPSPDGYQNADLFVPASGTAGRVEQATSTASANNTTYTGSVYFKKPTLAIDNITFYISDGSSALGSNRFGITVNLTNFTGTAFNFVNGVTTSVNVVSVGNDWYRAIFTGSVTSGATGNWAFAVRVLTTNATINGTNGLLIWGAQLELGAYASSYVNTLGAAVTRLADVCSKTGISSLIGQTEGTIFGEIEVVLGTTNMLAWMRKLSGGLYNDIILAYVSSTGIPNAQVDVGGISQVTISGASALTAGYHKVAFAYKQNDFVLYVDGVQIGNDTTGTVPACDEFYIDQYIDGGNRNATKKQFLLFKTRLTNAQLAEITAL